MDRPDATATTAPVPTSRRSIAAAALAAASSWAKVRWRRPSATAIRCGWAAAVAVSSASTGPSRRGRYAAAKAPPRTYARRLVSGTARLGELARVVERGAAVGAQRRLDELAGVGHRGVRPQDPGDRRGLDRHRVLGGDVDPVVGTDDPPLPRVQREQCRQPDLLVHDRVVGEADPDRLRGMRRAV